MLQNLKDVHCGAEIVVYVMSISQEKSSGLVCRPHPTGQTHTMLPLLPHSALPK